MTHNPDVRDSLEALKAGEIDEEEVHERHGDVDDINRSIAVAKAGRHQNMDFEELDEKTNIDLDDEHD